VGWVRVVPHPSPAATYSRPGPALAIVPLVFCCPPIIAGSAPRPLLPCHLPVSTIPHASSCSQWRVWVVAVRLSPSPLPCLPLALLFPSHCSLLPPHKQSLTAVVGGAGGSALALVLVLVRSSLPSLPVPPRSSTHPASSSSQRWWGRSSPRSPLPARPHIAPLSTPRAKARGGGWGVLLWWGSAHWVSPSSWSLSFHQQSTPRAVARGPGGGWWVVRSPSWLFPFPAASLVRPSVRPSLRPSRHPSLPRVPAWRPSSSVASTRDPPREQWLAGLGGGCCVAPRRRSSVGGVLGRSPFVRSALLGALLLVVGRWWAAVPFPIVPRRCSLRPVVTLRSTLRAVARKAGVGAGSFIVVPVVCCPGPGGWCCCSPCLLSAAPDIHPASRGSQQCGGWGVVAR
jgi:hypothetical protein